LQETFLFSGTILSNIRFARPEASYEEIIRAAKMANAHDFICRLPDGYQTYVGEKGHNLSGGERQRVAIARAILNDPRILILDEATASLDTESEYLIQKALQRLTSGRTTFAIAHRLSTLKDADRLIVIDGHRIAESGTHMELLEMKGIYYSLVKAQLMMQENEN
jgi:ATP-binding cassette subfamily B protein